MVEIQRVLGGRLSGDKPYSQPLRGTGSGLRIGARDWGRGEGKSTVKEDRSVRMYLAGYKGQKYGASGGQSGHSLSSCDMAS